MSSTSTSPYRIPTNPQERIKKEKVFGNMGHLQITFNHEVEQNNGHFPQTVTALQSLQI